LAGLSRNFIYLFPNASTSAISNQNRPPREEQRAAHCTLVESRQRDDGIPVDTIRQETALAICDLQLNAIVKFF
jgi:hypothetical protein